MSIGNLDFEDEFTSDEEVEDMFDSFIDYFSEQLENEDNKISIADPMRIKHILYTYKVLKYLTKGSKAKVTYKLNEPYVSMGSVSIVGKDLVFNNPEWLIAAVKLASNFNVYPKADGAVQMDFTFHGLTITLK